MWLTRGVGAASLDVLGTVSGHGERSLRLQIGRWSPAKRLLNVRRRAGHLSQPRR